MKVVDAHPRLHDSDVLFAESNRKNLQELLTQDIAPGQEVWDKETGEAYEKTLSYIGGAQIGLKNNEHQVSNLRAIHPIFRPIP